MFTLRCLGFVIVLLPSTLTPIQASILLMIFCKGNIAEPSTASVPDDIHFLQLAIYGIPTDSSLLWSRTNAYVPISSSLLNVLLSIMKHQISTVFASLGRWSFILDKRESHK